MSFKLLRNHFVIGSLGTSFTGFILLFTPYNQLSSALISAGLGSLAGSSLAIVKSQKIYSKKAKAFLTEIDGLKADTNHFSELLTDKHKQLNVMIIDRDDLLTTNQELVNSLKHTTEELKATKNQLQVTRDINVTSAIELVNESFSEFKSQLNSLLLTLSKRYPHIKKDWDSINFEYSKQIKEFSTQLATFTDNQGYSTDDLISIALAIQYEIIYRGSLLKIKCYKSVLTDLSKQLENSILVTDHDTKLEQVKEYYLSNIKAIQAEFGSIADNVVNCYKQDFSEVVNDGLTQSQELEQLQNQLLSLTNKVSELSKPLQFVGTSEPSRVGNSLIAYYHQKMGIVLDAIDFTSTDTGYKLMFHLSRNSRFIDTATLNDGNNSDKIKELSSSLNSPKFTQSERSNYVSLDIDLRKVEKKSLSIEDVRRLIEPSSKFGDVVSRYHEAKPTLRVMTRTGGGKGIAIKNLLHHYVNNLEGWELWLSDPQHGSFEDYWECSKIAKSPTEANKILAAFIEEFNNRKDGLSNNADIPIMLIQDECDKTFDRKQKAGISQIWTEIRHRKMKLILIGQSSEVGKQGWTWDEMNNCSLMFIGDAIGTAIKHSDDLGWSSDMKVKIPSIYAKVSEFFNQVNADIPIKNQYRFALLIDGMRFDFVEIPPALEGSFDNNKSWLVSSPWQSRAILEGQELACVHCGSTDLKKNGKVGEKQRYKCSGCGKSFTI